MNNKKETHEIDDLALLEGVDLSGDKSGKESSKKGQNIFGPVLRKLREERGWSQKVVSMKLRENGVILGVTLVSKTENTMRQLRDYELFGFAKVYDCTVGEIVEMYKEMKAAGLIEKPVKSEKGRKKKSE